MAAWNHCLAERVCDSAFGESICDAKISKGDGGGIYRSIRSDTNTLIDISSRDRYLCSLAASMNVQLKMLRKERRRYQKGDRQVKDAVTNISHDLRIPLTVICGYLDLLEKREKSETVGRYLQLIRNRTEVMRQLTEELFCYSIVTSTTHNHSYETVSLNAALEECISAYYAVLKTCRYLSDNFYAG